MAFCQYYNAPVYPNGNHNFTWRLCMEKKRQKERTGIKPSYDVSYNQIEINYG